MPSFDSIARLYRWLEYMTLGGALETCRGLQLARMAEARYVLVLGDGDGRFTAALLARYPAVCVVAIDSSPGMLALLSARVEALGAASRLTALHGNAVSLLAGPVEAIPGQPAAGFDYVCSHFFLDCLATAEVGRLVDGVGPRLAPGTAWIVSEFAAPSWWTRLVVALLYRGFALLAGLKAQQLPEWREVLATRGFVCQVNVQRLRGLLTSSVWRKIGETAFCSEENVCCLSRTGDAHRRAQAGQPRHALARPIGMTNQQGLSGLSFAANPYLFDTIPGIDPGPLPSPIPGSLPGLGPAADPEPDYDPGVEPDPVLPPGPEAPFPDPGFPGGIFPDPAPVT